MAKKQAKYRDRAPYKVNIVIEKKFQDDYKKVLKTIFTEISKELVKMAKDAR